MQAVLLLLTVKACSVRDSFVLCATFVLLRFHHSICWPGLISTKSLRDCMHNSLRIQVYLTANAFVINTAKSRLELDVRNSRSVSQSLDTPSSLVVIITVQ